MVVGSRWAPSPDTDDKSPAVAGLHLARPSSAVGSVETYYS